LANRTAEEGHRLEKFLAEELKKFDDVSGPTDRSSHHIRVKPGVQPIKQRYRPRNPAMQTIINQEVEKMEREGIIEPAHGPWSSPIVIIKKKDGSYRFCIDFRRISDVTEKDAYRK